MYDDIADIWDPVYRGRGRDYAGEVGQVLDAIRHRGPLGESLLDVACGTGEHLAHFGEHVAHVEGVELSEGMIAVGKRRRPELKLTHGDMRTFDLGRTFDVITCMFSSIGHAVDTDELAAALTRFAAHLAPGGVLVVEPWWFPSTFVDGYVTGDVLDVDGQTMARVSHSSREGDYSRVRVHYVVAGAEEGLRHVTEDLRITLFTQEEYLRGFERAGLAVQYVEGGPSGRGLFIAEHP